MKLQELKFLEKIKGLDGLDYLYLIGLVFVFIGIVLEYSLSSGLIFIGGSLMAVPIITLIINRGQ